LTKPVPSWENNGVPSRRCAEAWTSPIRDDGIAFTGPVHVTPLFVDVNRRTPPVFRSGVTPPK
jgi:hypothetical protein